MTHYLFKLLFTVRLLRAIIYSLGTEYILGNVNINAVVVPLRREEKRRGRVGIGERRHYNTRPMGPAFRRRCAEQKWVSRARCKSVALWTTVVRSRSKLVARHEQQQRRRSLLLIALT